MLYKHSTAGVAALAITGVALTIALTPTSIGQGRPPTQMETGTSGPPDRQMHDVLGALQQLGGTPIETLDATEARKQPTMANAVEQALKAQKKNAKPEVVGGVVNKTVPGPGGAIPIRIYTPKGVGPFPVVLYIHGGGWVLGDLDSYDASARAIANSATAVVVSTDYRRAPEHKFPAAHDDTFAAYQWILLNAATLKGDAKRVAVAGESAGGNMAAAIALRARDEHVQMPLRMVLIYPVANFATGTPSQNENSRAIPLNTAMLPWFYNKYLKPGDGDNPRFSIVRADLKGLPPATIITAQIDPLRSEGQALAAKLKAAGVDVSYKNFNGVTHEFFGMGTLLDKAKDAQDMVGADLKKSFGS